MNKTITIAMISSLLAACGGGGSSGGGSTDRAVNNFTEELEATKESVVEQATYIASIQEFPAFTDSDLTGIWLAVFAYAGSGRIFTAPPTPYDFASKEVSVIKFTQTGDELLAQTCDNEAIGTFTVNLNQNGSGTITPALNGAENIQVTKNKVIEFANYNYSYNIPANDDFPADSGDASGYFQLVKLDSSLDAPIGSLALGAVELNAACVEGYSLTSTEEGPDGIVDTISEHNITITATNGKSYESFGRIYEEGTGNDVGNPTYTVSNNLFLDLLLDDLSTTETTETINSILTIE